MTYLVNDKLLNVNIWIALKFVPLIVFMKVKICIINPDECIDCGVCEPECPVEAIIPDNLDDGTKWLDVNEKYSQVWPNISTKKDAPVDAKKWEGVQDKFENHFSEKGAD